MMPYVGYIEARYLIVNDIIILSDGYYWTIKEIKELSSGAIELTITNGLNIQLLTVGCYKSMKVAGHH